MDCHTNQKVYVNPNFNRTGTHLNKHFPHQAFNTTQNVQRKIYINPNFMALNNSDCNFQQINPIIVKQNMLYNEQKIIQKEQSTNSWNNLDVDKNLHIPNQQLIYDRLCPKAIDTEQRISVSNQSIAPPLVKSRYCLVNSFPKKQTTVKVVQTQEMPSFSSDEQTKSRYRFVKNNITDSIKINKPLNKSCTVKISKYKMVTVSSLKTTLQLSNILRKSLSATKFNLVTTKPPRPTILATSSNVIRNKFKLTKYNTKHNRSFSLESKGSTKLNVVSYNSKTRTKYTKKTHKRNFKINNVPCPLYSKYGKCLRKDKGNCEYLHDKKHVSLCRKFLKGICHDHNCTLSHELTDKKMPTCYFYLKGMCTKEQCPYVHIKLNEKTKLCQDFLKGYCEKGENCLLRHVKKQHSLKNVSFSLNKSFRKSPKLIKSKGVPPASNSLHSLKDTLNNKMNGDNCETERRYYKDIVSDGDEKCEVIKPMRCKLGTLPSFIQL